MKVKESELTEKLILPLHNHIQNGTVIFLQGDMGSGKTTFVNYFCSSLGITHTSSPTFAIANIYEGRFRVYHLDLYRLQTQDAVYSIDIDRYLDQSDGITLIEWPERLNEHEVSNPIWIVFKYVSPRIRDISIKL